MQRAGRLFVRVVGLALAAVSLTPASVIGQTTKATTIWRPSRTPDGRPDFQGIWDFRTVFNEMIHDARIIPMDGRSHLPAHIRPLLGDSRGRWDGDTLVVETTQFTDAHGFDN